MVGFGIIFTVVEVVTGVQMASPVAVIWIVNTPFKISLGPGTYWVFNKLASIKVPSEIPTFSHKYIVASVAIAVAL